MFNKLKTAFDTYDKCLLNKTVKFKLENGDIISCNFKKHNFLHLTGLQKKKGKISPNEFYDQLKNSRLKIDEYNFTDLSKMKLSVFDQLNFKIDDPVQVHKSNNGISVSFNVDYSVHKSSAIICIYKEFPRSLLKKSKPTAEGNLKGKVLSIE